MAQLISLFLFFLLVFSAQAKLEAPASSNSPSPSPAVTSLPETNMMTDVKINAEELAPLTELINRFFKIAPRQKADRTALLQEIRYSLKGFERRHLLRPEFSPIRFTDAELTRKLQSLLFYKKVAGPSVLSQTTHTLVVCITLLVGKCSSLPELQQPSVNKPGIEIMDGRR